MGISSDQRVSDTADSMQTDAIARGVLMSEMYALLKERKKDDA